MTYVKLEAFAEHRAVSKRTVERWIDKGLPSVKHGGGRRVMQELADAWLDSGEANRD